jgi:hypothetical protein
MSLALDDAKLKIFTDESCKPAAPEERRDLTRRKAIQHLLAGMAGVLSGPSLAAHPIYRHLSAGPLLKQSDGNVPAANWRPQFLSSTQNETLVAIAEGMVPGSTQAQVNRLIDRLLTVDTEANRTNFVSSLAAFNHVAQQKYGRSFPLLSPNQREDVLAACSTAKESPAMPAPADPDDITPPKTPVTEGDHFENLKGWIVGAYYATEQGMRELGWTEDFYFEELPACQHEAEHGQ